MGSPVVVMVSHDRWQLMMTDGTEPPASLKFVQLGRGDW